VADARQRVTDARLDEVQLTNSEPIDFTNALQHSNRNRLPRRNPPLSRLLVHSISAPATRWPSASPMPATGTGIPSQSTSSLPIHSWHTARTWVGSAAGEEADVAESRRILYSCRSGAAAAA
jgi:hypothetical protein